MTKLDSSWKTVKDKFKIVEVIGEGSYGQVVRAIERETKKVVAIKRISCSSSKMTYVLREISILKQLSQMPH